MKILREAKAFQRRGLYKLYSAFETLLGLSQEELRAVLYASRRLERTNWARLEREAKAEAEARLAAKLAARVLKSQTKRASRDAKKSLTSGVRSRYPARDRS